MFVYTKKLTIIGLLGYPYQICYIYNIYYYIFFKCIHIFSFNLSIILYYLIIQ